MYIFVQTVQINLKFEKKWKQSNGKSVRSFKIKFKILLITYNYVVCVIYLA